METGRVSRKECGTERMINTERSLLRTSSITIVIHHSTCIDIKYNVVIKINDLFYN